MSRYTGLKGRKILVVEDVELNQYLARHIMESWGCVVDIVENGSLAVERVKEADYDLVLMDIQMPVMDGMEATRIIRNMDDGYKSDVPIVALTANAMKSECATYLKAGMNDWLGKPFQEPALYDMVSKNIRKEPVSLITEISLPLMEQTEQKANKLYDLALVESISGGDRQFIRKMLHLFLETVPPMLDDMQQTVESGEWLMLSKHAHRLKSTIDSMGIASIKTVIREIETGGKSGEEPALLKAGVDQVADVMKQVMLQLQQELGEGMIN